MSITFKPLPTEEQIALWNKLQLRTKLVKKPKGYSTPIVDCCRDCPHYRDKKTKVFGMRCKLKDEKSYINFCVGWAGCDSSFKPNYEIRYGGSKRSEGNQQQLCNNYYKKYEEIKP